MGEEHTSHERKSSEFTVNEISSAGTTLIGSARSTGEHSFDSTDRNSTRYADVELKKWDTMRRPRKVRDHKGQNDEISETWSRSSISSADDEEIQGETGRLLHPHSKENEDEDESAPLALTTTHEDEGIPPPLQVISDCDGDPTKKAKPVSWSELPRKDQLGILTLARLSEPLAATSLQAYMFYMLKSFKTASGETPSDATVANQTGIMAAAFTGAQFATAIFWGRVADNQAMGRKRVILIGLLGSCLGTLGFGFCKNFPAAVFCRVFAGLLNGNVGVMRTMISETIKEKKFQSRAFLLLPMTFNIGVIVGPVLGGVLADPAGSYPSVFGAVGWMNRWPYALPNVVTASFLALGALAVFFGLEETLDGRKDQRDWGLSIGRYIGRGLRGAVGCGKRRPVYSSLSERDDVEMSVTPTSKKTRPYAGKHKLPFRRMWTRNVCFTLLAHGLLAMHVGTFNIIWFVFLSTPRYDSTATATSSTNIDKDTNSTLLQIPPDYHPHAPFTFTGGLAFPPPTIGTALAILGAMGLILQLTLFPRLSFKWGTERSFQRSLLLFPLSYVCAPYLATLPSTSPPPLHASGPLIWLGIAVVLAVQVSGRTFALPASQILINNACPHPSVLGTMHGFGQSASSGARTLGPVLAGWIYGVGLKKGMVGLAWWCLAGVAIVGAVAGQWVKEGDGREIWLEGEKEVEEEIVETKPA